MRGTPVPHCEEKIKIKIKRLLTVVSPSTGRSGHDHDIAAAEKDGDRLTLPRQTTDEKHGSIAQSRSKKKVSFEREKKKDVCAAAHDMDTSGEVEQTSERSTCAMRVSCHEGVFMKACKMQDRKQTLV
jgi:hypothetical protein